MGNDPFKKADRFLFSEKGKPVRLILVISTFLFIPLLLFGSEVMVAEFGNPFFFIGITFPWVLLIYFPAELHGYFDEEKVTPKVNKLYKALFILYVLFFWIVGGIWFFSV